MGTGLGCLVHLSPVPAPPETRMLHARRCRRQTGDQFCSTAGERRPTPPPRIGPARRRRRWLLLPAPDGLPGSPLRDTRPVHHHHDVALQHETSHVATTWPGGAGGAHLTCRAGCTAPHGRRRKATPDAAHVSGRGFASWARATSPNTAGRAYLHSPLVRAMHPSGGPSHHPPLLSHTPTPLLHVPPFSPIGRRRVRWLRNYSFCSSNQLYQILLMLNFDIF